VRTLFVVCCLLSPCLARGGVRAVARRFYPSPTTSFLDKSISQNTQHSALLENYESRLTIMTDPFPPRLYRKQYEEAVALFDNDDMEGCIDLAKYNLTLVATANPQK